MDDTVVYKRFPNVGEVYQDKAFTSTSTDEAVAFNGFFKGNVKITAQTKSGIKVDSFSATEGEKIRWGQSKFTLTPSYYPE
jgi:hypothetical protein